MLSIHDAERVERTCREWRLDARHLRRVRNAFYKHSLTAAESVAACPAPWAERLAREIRWESLRLESRHDSQLDGASRLVFCTQAGQRLESVILRAASGRVTVCVSCQVGCAAGCHFCATGQMGLRAQLSAAEIVDQVSHAGRLLRSEGRRLRNVVFMGMGEPFHNEESLIAALELLQSPSCFNLAGQRLLVSTVGVPAALVRCARRFPQVRLAVSLHGARQETRERLMPLARRHPLGELRDAMREAASIQQKPILLEYLLLDGVNDSWQEAAELIHFVRDLSVHVNLIPYNPIGALEWRGSDAATRRRFALQLKQAGLRVTTRYSQGADVAAACGQLAQRAASDADKDLLAIQPIANQP